MLILLSPSKTLDESSPFPAIDPTQPQFLKEAAELSALLRKMTPKALQKLMDISPKLAALNHERFARWQTPFTPQNSRPSIFTFKGDVYDGLQIECFDRASLERAQASLRILSGLYGLLRPFDLMQPYRLEMGTALPNPHGKNLYAFWQGRLTDALNREIAAHKHECVINLASQEYFAALQPQKLKAPLITPLFKERKGNQLKVIGLFAKKARGMMARHLLTQPKAEASAARGFTESGYAFDPALSNEAEWVFVRRAASKAA